MLLLLYPICGHILRNLFTFLSVQCTVCESLLSGITSGECCILEPFPVTIFFVLGEMYRNDLKNLQCILGEVQFMHYFHVFSFFVSKTSGKTILQSSLY